MKYLTQVYYNNTWVTLDTLRVSFERSLDWGKPMTATIEVDNRNGENRSICTLSSLIKIYRNDTLKFFGVIDKPSISVKPDGRNLTIQAKDYWTDKLMNTQTGDAYIWDFDHLDPVDVYRAFIGTMLIVQEKFQNFRRIDETTLNNLCILDQKLQLIKNGSTYQSTGSVTSKTLQNSTDWDRMGDIKSVNVSIEGTSISTGSSIGMPVSFSRPSTAYTLDGQQVAVNTPRYEYQHLPYPVWQDTFDTDQLAAQYTSGGDTPATWTVSNGVLTGTGGTQATLLKKNLMLQNCKIVVNSDRADDGGIIARYQDNNNYYLLALCDDSGVYENLRLYRRVNGAYTQFAYANVAWPRGTVKQIIFTLYGSCLEVYFDGVKVISVTDTTYTSGMVGLRNHDNTVRVLDWAVYYAQQGMMVEEGTTNLLTANQSDVETDLSGFHTWGSVTLSRDTTTAWHGTASAKATASANSTQSSISTDRVPVTAGTVYSASVYAKASVPRSGNLTIWWYDSNNTMITNHNVPISITTAWQRFVVTGTAPSNAASCHVELYCYNLVAGDNFWWDGAQLEAKVGATSWMLGGSTRSPEMSTASITGVFQKGNWTVKLEFTPTSNQANGRYDRLWEIGIDANNRYLLGHTPDGKLFSEILSRGTYYTIVDPTPLTVGQTYFITLSGNGSVMRLYKNGIQIGADCAYVEPDGTLPANIYIGVDSVVNSGKINGIISDFTVMNRAQTLAEHQMEYQTGYPLVKDVLLEVSRDDGETFTPMSLRWNGAQWTGSHIFSTEELLVNPGFENTGGWIDTARNYDISKTETTTADFSTGTLNSVQAVANSLKLNSSKSNLSEVWTTDFDFLTGTRTNVIIANDEMFGNAAAPNSIWESTYKISSIGIVGSSNIVWTGRNRHSVFANGNFENDMIGWVNGWYNGGGTFSIESGTSYNGSKCIKVVNSTPNPSQGSFIYNDSASANILTPNTVYECGYWYKIEVGKSPYTIWVAFDLKDSYDSWLAHVDSYQYVSHICDGQWHFAVFRFTTPANAYRANAYVFNFAQGTGWVDGFYLTPYYAIVETSLDGSTWYDQPYNGSIACIPAGTDCTGKYLHVRVKFNDNGNTCTAIQDITVNIQSQPIYYTSGYRTTTIDLSPAGVAKTSLITWDATKPANTNVVISASLDGVNYTTCTKGQPIPILTDGLNVVDKILYIKQELSTTDPYVTPSLDNLTVSIISKCNGVVETSNVDPYEGQKCLHLSCESYREPYNRVSQWYPATAGKTYVLSYRCKGLASNCKVYLEAWNSSGNWLGNVASTPTDSAQYVEYTLQYTVPTNTTAIDVVIQGNGTADARFDNFSLSGVLLNNKFKYRLTLNSFNNNTPLISSLLFKCQTESDTGVTLAYADTWNNPYTADDTITQSFGGMSRFQAITNLIKITGQEPYIDVDGKLYVYNSLNENLPILDLDTDNHLVNLDYALVRDAMCNALTLIGNGQVSTNVNIYGRVSLKDDASIAQYGWLEKTMSEKNIKDLGMLGARCYVILQQLKVPAEKISGSLIEPETSNITIGQRVRIIDITGSTGIDPTKVYRISQLQYSYNANGETISVEFANVRTELENAIEALTDYISSYMGVDQPAGLPVPATFMADCDKDNPCEKLVWIDPNKSPKRIILNVFSRAFQATSKGGAVHGQHSHKFWVYNHVHGMNHTHEISSHTHLIPHTHGHPPDGQEIRDILSGLSTAGGGATTSGASSEQTTGGGGQYESTSSEDSGHIHPLEYGIFKFGYFAPVTMHVNSPDIGAYPRFGTQGSETLDFTVTGLDITELYNKEGGVGKLAPGKNFIYFKTSATPNNPLGLLRIYTEILVIYD